MVLVVLLLLTECLASWWSAPGLGRLWQRDDQRPLLETRLGQPPVVHKCELLYALLRKGHRPLRIRAE